MSKPKESKEVVLVDESKVGERYVFSYTGKIPNEAIMKALEITGGNITRSADILGCSRWTIKNRLKASKTLQTKFEELKERKLDFAEDVLWSHISDNNLLATMFFLKTMGKTRGYTTQMEVVGDADKPVSININLGKSDSDEYS